MARIEVAGLSKSYGRTNVLNRVSFGVPAGSITGLLGPNGAGKTTLLRLMVGLGRPDEGQALFGGQRYVDLAEPTSVVGCLLDASAHHPGRSVSETVVLHARYIGLSAKRATEELMGVGLGPVLKRRFGALSLGMRQRVGLAIALLGRPTHLLLDEPMNGLDVETAAWVRERISGFAHRDGGCVLISSHLLQELQSFADRIVVLSQGRLAFEGGIEQTRNERSCIVLAPDTNGLVGALRSAGVGFEPPGPDGRIAVRAPAATVGGLAHRHSLLIEELVPGEARALESFYMTITKGDFSPEGGARHGNE